MLETPRKAISCSQVGRPYKPPLVPSILHHLYYLVGPGSILLVSGLPFFTESFPIMYLLDDAKVGLSVLFQSLLMEGSFSALCGSPAQFFLFSLPAKFWEVLGIFQQTSVTYTWLYMLWLLHLMTVEWCASYSSEGQFAKALSISGNCRRMNSICLLGTDFGFKLSMLRVLGCHTYVDWLFMSFQWIKKFLLSYFCFCLISVVCFLVFWKICSIYFRFAFLLVHLPKFLSASVFSILILMASHLDPIGTWSVPNKFWLCWILERKNTLDECYFSRTSLCWGFSKGYGLMLGSKIELNFC